MDSITINIDFELTDGDNSAARFLIAESLDEVISEALRSQEIDSGEAKILTYHVIPDQ